jgi:hypothetical protein
MTSYKWKGGGGGVRQILPNGPFPRTYEIRVMFRFLVTCLSVVAWLILYTRFDKKKGRELVGFQAHCPN